MDAAESTISAAGHVRSVAIADAAVQINMTPEHPPAWRATRNAARFAVTLAKLRYQDVFRTKKRPRDRDRLRHFNEAVRLIDHYSDGTISEAELLAKLPKHEPVPISVRRYRYRTPYWGWALGAAEVVIEAFCDGFLRGHGQHGGEPLTGETSAERDIELPLRWSDLSSSAPIPSSAFDAFVAAWTVGAYSLAEDIASSATVGIAGQP